MSRIVFKFACFDQYRSGLIRESAAGAEGHKFETRFQGRSAIFTIRSAYQCSTFWRNFVHYLPKCSFSKLSPDSYLDRKETSTFNTPYCHSLPPTTPVLKLPKSHPKLCPPPSTSTGIKDETESGNGLSRNFPQMSTTLLNGPFKPGTNPPHAI
ncbi:hypothetical protein AVEN_118025-1 [Araneus ventricosus]|uniref:Uncharacterized protein n=1 Tax=Araneus ventricosus TaxID=182803 RepID=A0A4Y2C947_ARAVE|nr:hypothetical protein AVEN_118025-1 [Araneus ventricosus]